MNNIVEDFTKQIDTLDEQREIAKYQTTIAEILNLYDYDNDGYFSQADIYVYRCNRFFLIIFIC